MRRRPERRARVASAAEEHPNLSGGLAVLVAVGILLEVLHRAIGKKVDRDVMSVWVAGRQLSQTIVGTHMLKDVATEAEMLINELEHHVDATKETTR